MAKLPFMPFFPSDYLRDTRCLSLAARGVWMDLICALWNSPTRGKKTLTIEGWAGEVGKGIEEVSGYISELNTQRIFSSSRKPNGLLTITSRRMVREEKARESNRIRQRRHYGRVTTQKPNAITNANITPDISYIRSHISEVISGEELIKKELIKKEGREAADAAPPQKVSVTTKGKRAIHDEDGPTDKHRVFAGELKIDWGPEWGKFKNYCLAHDKRYANFEAAFRNWLAKAAEMKGERRVL